MAPILTGRGREDIRVKGAAELLPKLRGKVPHLVRVGQWGSIAAPAVKTACQHSAVTDSFRQKWFESAGGSSCDHNWGSLNQDQWLVSHLAPVFSPASRL
jgi:hypothetical protein